MLEVGVVDVGVYSEKAFKDNFDDIYEVSGEGYTQLAREDFSLFS